MVGSSDRLLCALGWRAYFTNKEKVISSRYGFVLETEQAYRIGLGLQNCSHSWISDF